MNLETKKTLTLTKAEKKVLTDFYKNLADDETAYSIFCILQQIAENNLKRTVCTIEIVD